MTLTIRWSCAACGLHHQPVHVALRTTEAAETWRVYADRQARIAHARASPACPARWLTEMLVPCADGSLGGAPLQ